MTTPPLPETFDVVLGQRMAAAHAAGDTAGVEQARAYLVSEGTTDPADRAYLDAYTRALVVMQQVMAAQSAGERERADLLTEGLVAEIPAEILREVRLGMLFAAARNAGWLPADTYDELAARIPATGPLADQFRHIRRGESA